MANATANSSIVVLQNELICLKNETTQLNANVKEILKICDLPYSFRVYFDKFFTRFECILISSSLVSSVVLVNEFPRDRTTKPVINSSNECLKKSKRVKKLTKKNSKRVKKMTKNTSNEWRRSEFILETSVLLADNSIDIPNVPVSHSPSSKARPMGKEHSP